MRAAWYERPGPAETVLAVGDMATPEPRAGEVLVRVRVSAAHPSDVKLRAGGRPGMEGLPWPRIVPHSDGAGVIEAVGPGVSPARVGERVWLWNGQWERAFGTCAQYVALPSEQAVRLPEAAGFDAGACLGIPAVTAWSCTLGDGPVEGQTLLVTGGAGAVAQYAIQMGRRGGARVLSTVSSPEKAAFAREAGAHATINYREQDVAEAALDLTGGAGLDRVIDLEFGANIDAVARAIRPQGVIAAYGSAAAREPRLPFYTLMFKRVTLRMELVYLLPPAARRAAEAYLHEALETGALTHVVAARYPLEHAAQAHAHVESGRKTGVVLIDMP